MAPTKANAPEYSKDEKVLCFHLELLYEAKVLDVKQKDPNDKSDGYSYKIHYKGWKNTYVSFYCSFSFCFLDRLAICMARTRWNRRPFGGLRDATIVPWRLRIYLLLSIAER